MNDPMHILLIADPKITVPPVHYGGAERIIDLLGRELARLGHRVDLLAAKGSRSYGGRVAFHRLPGRSFLSRAWHKTRFQFQSLWMAGGADVIVNFGRLDYLEALLKTRRPLVLCFQNPVLQSEVDWVKARRQSRVTLVGISEDQVKDLKPAGLMKVIPNATDVAQFRFQEVPDNPPYLLFLGRVTLNKGADTAVAVAKRTGMHLKIAGNISDEPGDRDFFEQVIRPKLGNGVEYAGPVDDRQKNVLLGGAQALLFPIRWPEPFGIVMAESLACGTPVVATRCASTPEIVQDGVTGFLCDDEDAMVSAVARLPSIRREACRQSAEQRFSAEVLAAQFMEAIRPLTVV